MEHRDIVHNRQHATLNQMLQVMPSFLKEFFRGIADSKTSSTKLNYAYDLRNFFSYLVTEEVLFAGIELHAFSLADLSKVETEHIENFLEYTTFYEKNYSTAMHSDVTINRQNKEKGKSRKLTAIRIMYNYFIKKQKLINNPAEVVETPKLREKSITYLEVDETAKLLDRVEDGVSLTDKQKKYHKQTRNRDLAIVTLLLGTGIRVSECVGININHVSFETNTIKVIRKGGDEAIIYFGDEVADALGEYIKERKDINVKEGHEDALFLSMQNRRITERAVQNMVKKYARDVSLKNISPHKLRSTFGTHMYRETNDIYLVASLLGHKDVNTTKKHYASMDEERRRQAANALKLR